MKRSAIGYDKNGHITYVTLRPPDTLVVSAMRSHIIAYGMRIAIDAERAREVDQITHFFQHRDMNLQDCKEGGCAFVEQQKVVW